MHSFSIAVSVNQTVLICCEPVKKKKKKKASRPLRLIVLQSQTRQAERSPLGFPAHTLGNVFLSASVLEACTVHLQAHEMTIGNRPMTKGPTKMWRRQLGVWNVSFFSSSSYSCLTLVARSA